MFLFRSWKGRQYEQLCLAQGLRGGEEGSFSHPSGSGDPGAALALPVFMVIMFGVAIEFNVKNVALAVSDSDKTQSSRRLLDTFGSSDYFLIHRVASPHDAVTDVSAEHARAALIIPPNFEQDLFSGRGAEAQILVDGSDNSTVGPVLGYVGSIQNIASQRIGGFNPTPPYELRTRFLFNPELNSRWFVIPGLTVVVMAIISILLTTLTVAREWENGSMELLLSTPVQPLEIIVGKLAPYGILGIIAMIFVYVIAGLYSESPLWEASGSLASAPCSSS